MRAEPTVRLEVRLPAHLSEQVRQQCQEQGITQSAIVIQLLTEWLQQQQKGA